MKKLLLITFLLFFSFSFAQQIESRDYTVIKKRNQQLTLTNVSAYPNPLNTSTKINFESTKSQKIEFTVKNLLGKIVYHEIINSKIGNNTIPFKRYDLLKGMYIYSLQTETDIISKRLVIR
jgi:hypothetical protein